MNNRRKLKVINEIRRITGLEITEFFPIDSGRLPTNEELGELEDALSEKISSRQVDTLMKSVMGLLPADYKPRDRARGVFGRYDEKIVPVAADIISMQKIDRAPKKDEFTFFGEYRHLENLNINKRDLAFIMQRSLENLLSSGHVSAQLKEEIEALKQKMDEAGARPSILIREDEVTGATSLVDGGGFYVVDYGIADPELGKMGHELQLKFRIKKSARRDKYEIGRKAQAALALAKERGLLTDTGVNPIVFSDPARMITIEPFIEHDRLIDIIRKEKQAGGSNKEIIEELMGPMEATFRISEVLTENEELRDDNGNFVLKKNRNPLDLMRNFFNGNSAIPELDPLQNFLKGFAFRTVPEFERRYIGKNGELRTSKLAEVPELKMLADAFNEEFAALYAQRNQQIVNIDNHTANILIKRNPLQRTSDLEILTCEDSGAYGDRFVYTDFEFMRKHIIEDPLAELAITSGFEDGFIPATQGYFETILSELYENHRDSINVSKEQFLKTFERKLIEKLLVKASKFLYCSRQCKEGKDKEKLRKLANQAYSHAVELMETNGTSKTLEALQDYNAKHLHFERIDFSKEGEIPMDETVASLVSMIENRSYKEKIRKEKVRSLEMQDFKKSIKRGVMYAAIIAGAATAPLMAMSIAKRMDSHKAKQELQAQVQEAQKYEVVAQVNGDGLEVDNNYVEVTGVRVDGPIERDTDGIAVRFKQISPILPLDGVYPVSPGDNVSVYFNVGLKPLPNKARGINSSLEGKVYIEGEEEGENTFRVWPLPFDKSETDDWDGWMYSGTESMGSVYLQYEIPKDIPEGIHNMIIELYAPTNRTESDVRFNEGETIIRQVLPVSIGSYSGYPVLGKASFGGYKETIYFKALGIDNLATNVSYEISIPEEDFSDTLTVSQSSRSAFAHLNLPNGTNTETRTLSVSAKQNGREVSSAHLPIRRERIADNVHWWKLTTPDRNFSANIKKNRQRGRGR